MICLESLLSSFYDPNHAVKLTYNPLLKKSSESERGRMNGKEKPDAERSNEWWNQLIMTILSSL